MANILTVDDSAFMRATLKQIVEISGHKVVGFAVDGSEALRLYKTLRPHIVTMDIVMAGMDGLEALRAIMEEDPNAKVIMVTALGQEQIQEQALKLGATGYIRKPFKTDEIAGEINKVLDGE